MLAPSSELLRVGLGLKLNQVKRATRSYLRDRANHATGTVTSYAVAAGLFAASGLFLIAAIMVGIAALFRWVEINYGLFWAFGAAGALLFLIAIGCAALAASRLKRQSPHFPSLTSRLRVAVTANPLKSAPTEAVRERAATLMPASSAASSRAFSPAANRTGSGRVKPLMPSLRDNRPVQAGVVVAATLLGWVAMRRKSQKRRMDA